MQKYVVFICKENDLHCTLAESVYNKHAKKTKAIAAGKKTDTASPHTPGMLKENGLTAGKPEIYTFDLLQKAAKVITFGCESGVCLPFPSDEWRIEDQDFKIMHDIIEKKVKQLVKVIENDSNETI